MTSSNCRICIKSLGTVYIFDEQDNVQYSTKIMRCVNVSLSPEDKLPKYICNSCTSELTIAYEFIQKCEDSDRALRELVSDDKTYDVPKHQFKVKEELFVKDELFSHDECDDSFENISDSFFEVNKPVVSKKQSKSKKSNKNDIFNDTEKKPRKKYDRTNRPPKMEPLQCVVCGLFVKSHAAMKIHARIHTGEKPYNCSYCDLKFSAKGGLKRHIMTFHSKRERRFTCETCGNSFYTRNDIILHLRRHTGEKPYVCPYCSKRFLQVASLIRHKRTHTGDKPYSCTVCEKRFTDKSMVSKHMLVHTDEKKFTCHLCNKSLKSSNSLRIHLNRHTNEKSFVCAVCGVACSSKGNLKTHTLRVHSEKSGECAVCSKTFSDLETHMRKHTGEKPFACIYCNKAFRTKRSLSYHVMFKHEKDNKFKCSIGECEKTFPTGPMLEFHLLKYHTNHTPFICHHCSRGFFRASDLSRHLRVSHMESPLKIHLTPKSETPA